MRNEIIKNFKEELEKYEELKGKVLIEKVLKNNDTELTSVRIMEKEKIIPVIYIDDLIDKILNQEITLKEGIENYIHTYENACNVDKIRNLKEVFSQYSNYNSVKDKIIPCLINKRMNQKRLEDYTHFEILDLAVIFKIIIDENEEGISTATVTNKMLKDWKIDKDTIYKDAIRNIEKEEVVFSPLDLMIKEMTGMELEEEKIPLFILTASNKNCGAAVILRNDVKEMIKESFGNAYIIPSSIHELLIVPYEENREEELTNMVREVNQSAVMNQNILSDHVYKFISGELSL